MMGSELTAQERKKDAEPPPWDVLSMVIIAIVECAGNRD
jgi:hypothetical protein